MTQKKLGYDDNINNWDKKYEKKLTKLVNKGVVKLFNSIYDFRKKIKDEKEIEGYF